MAQADIPEKTHPECRNRSGNRAVLDKIFFDFGPPPFPKLRPNGMSLLTKS